MAFIEFVGLNASNVTNAKNPTNAINKLVYNEENNARKER